MNTHNNIDEKLNNQIRKFLKQVGVETHQILTEQVNINQNELDIELKLKINGKEVKSFNTSLTN